jgi:DNA invertase Pin-like site-specific DNA recombinase
MTKPAPMRFALCLRVSSRGQEDGQSLLVQKKFGEEYIRRNGGRLVKTYEGVESATKSLQERDLLQQILRDAAEEKWDALWVLDQSRLTRSPETLQLVASHFSLYNRELHTQGGRTPLETPEGELQAGIQSQSDRYFAQKIAQRTRQSRAELLSKGKHAFGRWPWGLRWNKNSQEWEIDAEKQALIVKAQRLYVEKGLSLGEVATRLEIPKSTLTKAFESAGKAVRTVSLKTPEGVIKYRLAIPPLLTAAQSNAVLKRKQMNATIRPGMEKSRWMLQGVIRCWHCGGNLSGTPSRKGGGEKYLVYRHLPTSRGPLCLWHVPAQLVQEDVVHACAQVLQNNAKLTAAIKQAVADATNVRDNVIEQLQELDKSQQNRRRRLERAKNELLALNGREAACQELRMEIHKVSDAIADGEVERRGLETKSALLQAPQMRPSEIAARLRAITGLEGLASLSMLTPSQQRDLVLLIVGRERRNSLYGIFVKARRVGKKKLLVWDWELRGALGVGDGTSARVHELANRPSGKGRSLEPSAIRKLAELARSAKPVGYKSSPLCS